MAGQGVQHLVVRQGVPAGPGGDGALTDRQIGVGNNKFFIEEHLRAQTAAFGTGAVRTVEGEHARSKFRQADATGGAGVSLAEQEFPALGELDPDQPVGQAGGCFQGIPQALTNPFLHYQPVNNHIDIVTLLFFKGDAIRKFMKFSIDADPDKTVFEQFLEFFLEFSFLALDERRQNG